MLFSFDFFDEDLQQIRKYGNAHRQIRALVILDALIQNAGSRFQKAFADEPLLERLRILARDETVDADVRKRVNLLFRQWAIAYKGTTGLERIAALHKELLEGVSPSPSSLESSGNKMPKQLVSAKSIHRPLHLNPGVQILHTSLLRQASR